jgi:hypothetical protein
VRSELFAIDGDGDWAINYDRLTMIAESTQSPVIVRRDPDGTWWVMVFDPGGGLHGHTFDDSQLVDEYGVADSAYAKALHCADRHADTLRTIERARALAERGFTPASAPDILRSMAEDLERMTRNTRKDHP